MKVLQINAVNKVSSTGRTVYELSEYLNSNGHDCVAAYSKGISVNPQKEFVIGNSLDVKLHGLLSRFFGTQGYFSKTATRKLLRFMDNYKPNVVMLRNLHGNYINLPMLLKYLAKNDIATVAVLHDCWFYTGKCCHYTVDNCYRWQENCGQCVSLKKYNKSWFFDRTRKLLSDKKKLFGAIPRLAVVGVSDWLIREAKKAPVFQKARIFKRIYNWVDTEVFKPQDTHELREKLGLKDKKIILSVSSFWSREKGLKTVLEIADKLNENEVFLLVGNVPDDVKLGKNIIHIPTTNSVTELAEYYSLADVFLQPSLEETFGKVTAEALSSGTPAVCFNSTANPELIGEDCGAVADDFTADAALLKIREILSKDKNFYKESCRNFVLENFKKEEKLKEYFSVFEIICNKY